MRKSDYRLLAGISALTLAGLAAPAQAQAGAADRDSAEAATENEADSEVIYVTARRRDERLQDVPESVTAFSSREIENAGISDMRDIAELTPNFSQLDNYRPGLARFQIRGLITPQVGDPPLAFVYDGITAPDPEFVNQELFDIERVEVLRGAQGALYGRGAIGGAVNVVTRQPGAQLEGSVRASYANGESWRGSAVLSGPLGEGVYFRLGGFYSDSEGLIENVFLGTGADYLRDFGLIAQIKAEVGPRTTLDLNAQYGDSRAGIGYYQAVEISTASIEDFSIPTTQNVLGVDEREIYQFSAKLEHEFDFATLTVAGGYSNADDNSVSDGDYVALPSDGEFFFPGLQHALLQTQAWTFEGRLTSNDGGPLNWALGTFYQDRTRNSDFFFYDDLDGTIPLTPADIDPDLLFFAIFDENTSKAWAVSGQASYTFADVFEVTVAGRYDHDKRTSFDRRDVDLTFAEATFDEFQPKVSLSYEISPDVLVYTGYSKGFRSGGFNEFSEFTSRTYGKETSDSYELGFKSTFAGGLVTLNGALFRIDQTNAQLTQFNPISFTLENVAIDSVRSQGLEAELAVRPTSGLNLRMSYGYTDSEIREFGANPTVVGFSMPYIPKYNLAVSADYQTALTDMLDLNLYASYRRNGSRNFTLDFLDLRSDQHDFVDLRAGVGNGAWKITAFVENLFNERQPEDVFSLFNGAVELARQPNRPRQYGVELRYDF